MDACLGIDTRKDGLKASNRKLAIVHFNRSFSKFLTERINVVVQHRDTLRRSRNQAPPALGGRRHEASSEHLEEFWRHGSHSHQ